MKLTTQVLGQDMFDGLTPENEQEIKRFQANPVPLDRVIGGFEKILELYPYHGVANEDQLHALILNKAPIRVSSKEIFGFSLRLENYQDNEYFQEVAGFYLSALIDHTDESKIHLPLSHLETKLWHVGFKVKEKNIYINGNVGSFIGRRMIKSRMVIYGDADDFLGDDMKESTITLHGNVGGWPGAGLDGKSVIYLNGGYVSTPWLARGLFRGRGTIYHKGKLIVENGRKVE